MSGERQRGGRSIATSMRIAIAGSSALVLLVAFLALLLLWPRFVVSQRTAEISRQVIALASAERQAAPGTENDPVRRSLFRVEAGLLGATLMVTDEDGSVLRSSDEDAMLRSLDMDVLSVAGDNGVRHGTVRATDNDRLLIVAAPVGDGRQMIAIQRLSEIREARAGVFLLVSLALMLALVVAWIAGGWIARRLTDPLVRLKHGAERIAAGDFGARVTEEGDAETTSLARSFNRMSERVSQAYDSQRAFVGDVSHEIRTPLTSIGGFAGALLDGTISDPDEAKRALGVIKSEAQRIQDLSNTLLALAQLDAGAVQLSSEPVDLPVIADTLRSRFEPPAAEKRITFEVILDSDQPPWADTERLLQAASALVSNAVAYAPQGGHVVVSDESKDGVYRLFVDDDGPGVPFEKRGLVFERFARVDESRSSASGGAGLGLAICARLTDLMGGCAMVEDSALGGARFTIELPISA